MSLEQKNDLETPLEEVPLANRYVPEFTLMFQFIPDAVVYADTNRNIVEINPAFQKIFGYSLDEVYGKPTAILYASEEDFYEQGRLRYNLSAAKKDKPYLVTYRRKNGEAFSGETISGVVKNKQQEGFAFVGIIRDISERIALQNKAAWINKLSENTSIVPWKVDLRSGNFLYLGKQASKILGYTMEQWRQFDFWITKLHPDDRQPILEKYRSAIAGSQKFNLEYRLVGENQQVYWVKNFCNVLRGDDGELLMEGFLVDITDQKATEIALRKTNDELERFAYIASHDLQEPLRKIISFSEMLNRDYRENLDERAQRYLDFVVGGASRMKNLISALLKYSGINHKNLQFSSVDSAAVFKHVLKSVASEIKKADAEIRCADLPIVWGDKKALAEMFQHLLKNALKFRSEKPLVIEVDVRKKQRYWEFSMADNGIGFETEFTERIFNLFQTLHSRGRYAGIGFGLALVKRIVEVHGGEINAESPESHGTCIRFTLPADRKQIDKN